MIEHDKTAKLQFLFLLIEFLCGQFLGLNILLNIDSKKFKKNKKPLSLALWSVSLHQLLELLIHLTYNSSSNAVKFDGAFSLEAILTVISHKLCSTISSCLGSIIFQTFCDRSINNFTRDVVYQTIETHFDLTFLTRKKLD
ncbi:hypothetical protein BpHYR1_048010 [Brachionus plicatilis]|uniref:Uncharacterized protein n=1 Tax=Brachionus plicatilis TaxID=10195 RepID=A0A3M7TA21_BRAPC|nr:hypothetical protein BpHYR1_048010 [Brachionus plicatilis]